MFGVVCIPVHVITGKYSDGVYELKTVPDVLGMHARQPEAAVIKVLLGHDSRSVRALVLDAKVWDLGFYEITLLDMGDIAGSDVSMADLSLLRLQWPVHVVASMSRLQRELEHLRHVCKKGYRGMCRHVSNYHLELPQLWRCPVSW